MLGEMGELIPINIEAPSHETVTERLVKGRTTSTTKCRQALKAAAHHFSARLKAPARKRFYLLLSSGEVLMGVLRLPH